MNNQQEYILMGLIKPEPREGHEGWIDYPCCETASLNCSCGGVGEWYPCDCEECQELYLQQAKEKVAKIMAEHGEEIVISMLTIARLAPPTSWVNQKTYEIGCAFCLGKGIYHAQSIVHFDDCPYAKARQIFGLDVEVKPYSALDPCGSALGGRDYRGKVSITRHFKRSG